MDICLVVFKYVCMCVEARGCLWVIFSVSSPPYSLKQDLSLSLEFNEQPVNPTDSLVPQTLLYVKSEICKLNKNHAVLYSPFSL